MADLEVIALDPVEPQLRAPTSGDNYKFPRPARFDMGTISRVSSATSVTTPLAWNSNSFDVYEITALAGDITISADAGTPINGQKILFRIKDDGVPRTLTWVTGTARSFRAVGVIIPTVTLANKLLYAGGIYNSTDARWDIIAVGQEL